MTTMTKSKPKVKVNVESALEDFAKGKSEYTLIQELLDEGQVTTEQVLTVVTKNLRQIDVKKDEYDEKREDARDWFFDLATRHIKATRPLERKSELVNASPITLAGVIAKKFPQFKVLSSRDNLDGTFDVLLEEDPELSKFEWTNESIGFLFKRGRQMRGAGFDTETFVREQPGLANRCVDQIVSVKLPLVTSDLGMTLTDLIASGRATVTHSLDEDRAEKMLSDFPEHMETFQKYDNPGKPSMTLAKPTKVKAAKKK